MRNNAGCSDDGVMDAEQGPEALLCRACRSLLEERPILEQLIIPERDGREQYPGGIEPGYYSIQQLVDLLRAHKNNPDAIQFLADMIEL